MNKTPNCCANCAWCMRMLEPAGYLGGATYWCKRFKKVVKPQEDTCKEHERYMGDSAFKCNNKGIAHD